MFEKLRQRWGISAMRVVLVLMTFAIGGSLCGYAARHIMLLLDVPSRIVWWALYLALVTILWPVAVMVVSLPFGQFYFFKSYLTRLARRIFQGKKTMPKDQERRRPEHSDSV